VKALIAQDMFSPTPIVLLSSDDGDRPRSSTTSCSSAIGRAFRLEDT